MKKKLLVILAAAFILTGCGQNAVTKVVLSQDNKTSVSENISEENEFIITLHPEAAPVTCENFQRLVEDKFYDGLTFHRVINDFMAQGGDPLGNGTGGSPYKIRGEFEQNGYTNPLSHRRGIVSMARSDDFDSASSQFFICYTDECAFLNGGYAAFGEVTKGMEVIDSFLEVKRGGMEGATPETPIVIKEAVMIEPDGSGNPRVKFMMEKFL